MSFNLKYKNIDENREIAKENYAIKDLLNDLGLSTQTTVAKQNGELTVEDTIIEEGDEIQLIQIIYGG
ncbi:MAG: MoaD/ThiS family protein [Methanobrevibacter sp.]|nr:MoaD/ThiS family protein [Methanobrevibacter sp.]